MVFFLKGRLVKNIEEAANVVLLVRSNVTFTWKTKIMRYPLKVCEA